MSKSIIEKDLTKPIHLSARRVRRVLLQNRTIEEIELLAEMPFGEITFSFQLQIDSDGESSFDVSGEAIDTVAGQLPNVKRRSKAANEAILNWINQRIDEYVNATICK
jgi:hypothetical protein